MSAVPPPLVSPHHQLFLAPPLFPTNIDRYHAVTSLTPMYVNITNGAYPHPHCVDFVNHNGPAAYLVAPPPHTHDPTTPPPLADCGCTDTLVREADIYLARDVQPTSTGILVTYPNGATARAIATGYLVVPSSARVIIPVHIMRNADLHRSLISVGQLCNQGCTAVLTDSHITITDSHTGAVILAGAKAPSATLWPLSPITTPPAAAPALPDSHANLAQRHALNADFVNWAHACFGAPPASSFLHAARNGWLSGFPRLTPQLIYDNMPNAVATAMGHLDANRQGQRSTRRSLPTTVSTSPAPSPPTAIASPAAEEPADSAIDTDTTALVSHVITVTADDVRAHADLMGRFPFPSHTGNQYLLATVHGGYVHLEALRDRTGPSYVKAFRATIDFFALRGVHRPTIYRIDNEGSRLVDQLFAANNIQREYVPAGDHRANKAERAIRDAKAHLIASLCLVHREFPLKLWDELLPQTELTLNLLRPWRPNPTVSAYHGLYGHQYNFDAHPLAPVGTLVVIHNARPPAGDRLSWSPHGAEGFYLGPALDHYRAYRVYDAITTGLRVSNSLSWHPAPFPMPGSSPVELAIAAIDDLASALQAAARSHLPPADRQPFEQCATSATDALRALTDQFINPLPGAEPAVQPHYQGAARAARSRPAAVPPPATPPLPVPPPAPQRVAPVDAASADPLPPQRVEPPAGVPDMPPLASPPVERPRAQAPPPSPTHLRGWWSLPFPRSASRARTRARRAPRQLPPSRCPPLQIAPPSRGRVPSLFRALRRRPASAPCVGALPSSAPAAYRPLDQHDAAATPLRYSRQLQMACTSPRRLLAAAVRRRASFLTSPQRPVVAPSGALAA